MGRQPETSRGTRTAGFASFGRSAFALAMLFAALTLGSAARAEDDVEIVPAGSRVAGKTIGQWTGEWWRTAIESVDFPFPTGGSYPGALGDTGGPVFFAVVSPGPGSTTFTYDVPAKKYILLPLYTYTWMSHSPGDPCSDYACAIALSNQFTYATTSLSVVIDGKRVPAHKLFRHYERTPRIYHATVPPDGWWIILPTDVGDWFGVASGYWLMLEPLSAGTHTLSVSVTAPYDQNCDASGICSPGSLDVSQTKLTLHVVCRKKKPSRCEKDD